MDWKVVLVIFGSVIATGLRDDILDLEHTRPNHFSNVRWLDKPNKSSRKRRSSTPEVRHRRETSSSSCTAENLFDEKMKLATAKMVFKGDSNPSIALAWTGDDGDTLLAVTTYESFVSFPSNLYRSTNGGRNFDNITAQIDGEYIRRKNGVLTATADSKRVILIVNNHPLGFSESATIYVTKDKGGTWKRIEVPFELSGAQMKFHPTNADMILATDMNEGKLWISRDFSTSWKAVHESGKAHAYKWDPVDKSGKVFYYTHDPTGMGRRQNFALTLYRSQDAGESVEKLAEHVWSFGTEDKFLFVSVRYQPEGQDKPSRIMHVSTDKGDKFNAVQLPAISSDQFYSILDANEDMIFMHVDDVGDTGKGTIFTSDETGIIFSKSLEKNLYPNGDDVTDFVRIESLNGVYVTSQLKDDQSIESLITYDKGATWDKFLQPLNCVDGHHCGCNTTSDEYCHLQIHCAFSISKGVKVPEGPYSTVNAPGLIFGHGNVGDALSTDDPDLFVSSDGGYNWNRSLMGPHKTLIGDSGAVVWAVVQEEEIDTLKFSFDEGLCWHKYKFAEKNITITGLIAEPGEKATDVAIWGWDDEVDSWVVYTFDFKSIMGQQCDDNSDYDTWLAHEEIKLKDDDEEKGCQLGQKIYYRKLKKESVCYQGKLFEPNTNPKPCTCTKYDFLCDYGYIRDTNTGECVDDPNFGNRNADICINEEEEEIVTHGYKKIPGDKCDETKMQNQERYQSTIKKIKKKCPKQAEISEDYGMEGTDSWIDYKDLYDLFGKPEKLLSSSEKQELKVIEGLEDMPTSHGGLIALLIIGIICSVGAAGYFYRKSKTPTTVVQYQTFTDDDVPRLDVGTPIQYRDDAESEDDDMLA